MLKTQIKFLATSLLCGICIAACKEDPRNFVTLEAINSSVIQVVAFGAAVASIWRFALMPTLRWVRLVTEQIEKIGAASAWISENMSANGGASLRDAINRIEKEVSVINHRVRAWIAITDDVGYFEADERGRYSYVNRAWCEMMGALPEDALGAGWINSVHPEDRQNVIKEWTQALADSREFDLSYRCETEDGGSFRVKCKATILSHSGRCVGYVGVVRRS